MSCSHLTHSSHSRPPGTTGDPLSSGDSYHDCSASRPTRSPKTHCHCHIGRLHTHAHARTHCHWAQIPPSAASQTQHRQRLSSEHIIWPPSQIMLSWGEVQSTQQNSKIRNVKSTMWISRENMGQGEKMYSVFHLGFFSCTLHFVIDLYTMQIQSSKQATWDRWIY